MANVFTLDGNCVALWKFESGALTTDSIGTNTLTNNNTVLTSTGDYKEGSACANFEGTVSQDHFSIVDANLDAGFPLKSGDTNKKISVCGWFKADAVDGSRGLFSKFSTIPAQRSLSIQVSSATFWAGIGYNSGADSEALYSGGTVTAGRWYHFGFTFDDSDKSWKFVVWDDTAGSKVIDGSGTATNNINIEDGPVTIGAVKGELPTSFFDGLIDEVVVFKDILTAGEIDLIRAGTFNAGLLVVQNSYHAQAADNADLTPKYIVVQDSYHAQAVGNVSGNLHLAPAGSYHAHAVSSPFVNKMISVADAYHAQAVSTPQLVIHLAPADAYHAHAVTALGSILYIMGADSYHAQTVTGGLALTQKKIHALANIQNALVVDVKNIIQDTTYSYDDILAWLNEAQSVIAGGILLVFPDTTQVFSSPLDGLETSSTVTAGTTNAYVALPSDYQRELFWIYNETTGVQVTIVGSFSRLLEGCPTLDRIQSVIHAVIDGHRLYYQGIPESAETLELGYFRKPRTMASYSSTGISFSGTTIADSNNGFGVFYAGQTIDLLGSYDNRGVYIISSVETDGSEMEVDSATVTESAGDTISIKSRPDGIPDVLQTDLLTNYAILKYLNRHKPNLIFDYREKFYKAMLDLEVFQERVRIPIKWGIAA